MGIRSIHRAGAAELRAARRFKRRWADGGEKGCRLVRGTLYRRDAAQPAGSGDDRGDDPPGGGDTELRPIGVPASAGRGVSAGPLPGHAGAGWRLLSAADSARARRRVQSPSRGELRLRALGSASLETAGRKLHQLVTSLVAGRAYLALMLTAAG